MPRTRILGSHPRGALAERTNIPVALDASSSTIKSWLAPPKRAQCKRPLDVTEEGHRKRVKISSDEIYSDESDAYESDSDVEMQRVGSCHRRIPLWNLAAQPRPCASSRRPFCSSLFHIPRVFIDLSDSFYIANPAILRVLQ